MLFHTEGSWVEIKSIRREWDSNIPSWQDFCKPYSDIIGGYLHKEDRVWRISRPIMAHLGEKCSGNDEYDAEDEVSEGQSR